mgnify:FL=1
MFVIAKIQVKNFTKLEVFENIVQSYLSSVGGKMLHAFEIAQIAGSNNEEVHILEFPNEKCFEEYKVKTNIPSLNSLREEAIKSIEIKLSTKNKVYKSKSA